MNRKAALLTHLAAPDRYGAKAAPAAHAPDTLTKASHAELEIKADGEEGEIRGYGSVFDKVDSYGEVVVAGAFAKSLRRWKQKPIPMLWQHWSDQPIGVWDQYEEDRKGLKLAGRLNLETQRGREAWSDIKIGSVPGLSIGYFEIKADPISWESSEPRKLLELDLREVSPVTFPALKEATIDAVKARTLRGERLTIREFESFLREKLNVSRSDAEDIAREGYKTWRQRDVGTGDENPLAVLREMREGLGPLDLPTFTRS